jgi:hypothetical protein
MPDVSPASLTTEGACAALREAGLDLAPAEVSVQRRDDRWAVALPGGRMAWFPATEQARARLAVERKVLRLLAERCTFAAPRILFGSPAGFDVRAIVPGLIDPSGIYQRTRHDRALARDTGRAIGGILVQQHTRVAAADVAGWLPQRVAWPEPRAWIVERLPDVVDDVPLIAAIDEMLAAYEALSIDPADRVLVHGDVGLHNLAFDPATLEVRGAFDYDGAAWDDRHHDFRYLVDLAHDAMLEGALAVYEPALGRTLSRQRIWLYNAVCAFSYLAFRRGVPAEQNWCGRTLAEDLAWVRGALDRLDRTDSLSSG